MNLTSIVGVAAGALALVAFLKLNKEKIMDLKMELNELVIAARYITTPKDAVLLTMRAQLLGVQMLAEIHTQMVKTDKRSLTDENRFRELVEEDRATKNEANDLLRKIAEALAPQTSDLSPEDTDTQIDAYLESFTKEERDDLFEKCVAIAAGAAEAKFDPYPAMCELLWGNAYVPEDRDRVKRWFFAEQYKRVGQRGGAVDAWADGLRRRHSPARLDELYAACVEIAKGNRPGQDPYPAMGAVLLSTDYVPEDREHVKDWFFIEQIKRGDVEVAKK